MHIVRATGSELWVYYSELRFDGQPCGEGTAVPTDERKRAGTGRRPPDRKQRIAAAADQLFRERGFHNVSVADVAEAVGITAPALYRHFRNKQELLAHVVREGLDVMDTLAGTATDLNDLLRRMSALPAERPQLATLWQREVRHLPDEPREELRRRLSGIADTFSALVRAERPELSRDDADLLAWAVLAVFASMSSHRITLPRRRLESLLHRLSIAAAHCELGSAAAESATARPGDARTVGSSGIGASRRERLLTEAIRLFDERGFQSVGTIDIGEAVGMAGPSIYRHFPSKADLLVAAFYRGGERREAGTVQALSRATGPREALDLLLRSYVDFALENSRLLGVLVSELGQLPEHDRKTSLQVQRDYLALWGNVLDAAVPGWDPVEAKIAVRAVLSVVENVARTGRLADRSDVADRLTEIGRALLLSG